MNNIPITFWPQLVARFKATNPKFFNVLAANSIYFTLISIAGPFVIKELLPGFGIAVPQWLSYSNTLFVSISTALAGVGVGSALASQTALQTPETPLLVSSEDKPKTEDISALVAQAVAEEMAKIQNQNKPTSQL